MALKSTIYKVLLHVSDMSRSHYAQYPLTLARHPSETEERLLMRVLAFALCAHERLRFGAGLSAAEEPDLLLEDYSGAITHWIEVGLPEPRWIAKALSKSDRVTVLVFGGNLDRWFKSLEEHFPRRSEMTRLEVIVAEAAEPLALQRLAARNLELSCTIDDGQAWLTGPSDTVTFTVTRR
jgi:uncharacterized protein YaeQ